MVSSTPRLLFTPGKDLVPIVQEAGWAPGPVWTGGKSRPHQDSILHHPAHSQSLYRLSYPALTVVLYRFKCITFVAVVLMMQASLFAVHIESTVVLKISNLALISFSHNFLKETSYKPQLTALLKIGSYVLGW